jgi:hypothetical protein
MHQRGFSNETGAGRYQRRSSMLHQEPEEPGQLKIDGAEIYNVED